MVWEAAGSDFYGRLLLAVICIQPARARSPGPLPPIQLAVAVQWFLSPPHKSLWFCSDLCRKAGAVNRIGGWQ